MHFEGQLIATSNWRFAINLKVTQKCCFAALIQGACDCHLHIYLPSWYCGLQVMYWVVFCCMAASATAFAAMTFSTPMALRSHGCECKTTLCSPQQEHSAPSISSNFGVKSEYHAKHIQLCHWLDRHGHALLLRDASVAADLSTTIVTIAAIAYYVMVGGHTIGRSKSANRWSFIVHHGLPQRVPECGHESGQARAIPMHALLATVCSLAVGLLRAMC